jgi:hypothetical protein
MFWPARNFVEKLRKFHFPILFAVYNVALALLQCNIHELLEKGGQTRPLFKVKTPVNLRHEYLSATNTTMYSVRVSQYIGKCQTKLLFIGCSSRGVPVAEPYSLADRGYPSGF